MQDAKYEIARTTCKEKLNSPGIHKDKDQKFVMEQVFANNENAILESEDKHQVETRLKTVWPLLDKNGEMADGYLIATVWCVPFQKRKDEEESDDQKCEEES